MLGWFIRLGLPRFLGILGDNVHNFLLSCLERLHNLGLAELHRVDYTMFYLNELAK